LEIDLVSSEDGTQTGMVEMIMVINLPRITKSEKYIHARLSKASVSKVIIERTLKLVTVTITTARPGIIIGKVDKR
jgi:ribosomal protein S3